MLIEIDEIKCIGCSACVKDCPITIIEMGRDGLPFIKPANEEKCMKCQHCLAICPTAALSIEGKQPADSIPSMKMATPEQMEALIKNRRSVRHFKQNNLPTEKLDKLIQVSANAPTGKNTRSVSLHLIDDRAELEKFADKVFTHIEQMHTDGKLEDGNFFLTLAKAYRKGTDIVFRGAPHLVVASAPKDGPSPTADCFITLSYMELMAYSMGIGTVWLGFLMYIFDLAPELKELLNIPEDHDLVYAMLLGDPAKKYPRGVQRDEISVNRVKFH